MFTSKPGTRYAVVIRIFLIVVVFSNALTPTAAAAISPSNTERADLLSASMIGSQGIRGSAVKLPELIHSRTTLQDTTPTVPATNTEAPTPELVVTSTFETTPTLAETLVATPTPESTPTPTVTQNASETATEITTQTLAVTSQPPVLSFKFSVTPEQAAPGDEVTFTIEVENNGQTPATGLLFPIYSHRNLATGKADSRISISTYRPICLPGVALRQVYQRWRQDKNLP
jgi:hypothetical protein